MIRKLQTQQKYYGRVFYILLQEMLNICICKFEGTAINHFLDCLCSCSAPPSREFGHVTEGRSGCCYRAPLTEGRDAASSFTVTVLFTAAFTPVTMA